MATILAPISIILGVMAHSKGQRFGIISILLGVTAIIVMNIPSNYFTSKSSKRSNVKQNSFNSSSNNYIPSRSIEQEINDFAEREYPNDYKMQKYIYNQQIESYKYMSTVGDMECKNFAQREYPNDYRMQKYIYNQQVDAKSFMKNASNKYSKSKAQREYPNDYRMQKYIYNK